MEVQRDVDGIPKQSSPLHSRDPPGGAHADHGVNNSLQPNPGDSDTYMSHDNDPASSHYIGDNGDSLMEILPMHNPLERKHGNCKEDI